MEENTNRQIKINGATVFFIFILIIGLTGATVFFGYEWYNLKNTETVQGYAEGENTGNTQELDELKKEVENLKTENDKLKEFIFTEVGEDIWTEYITFDKIEQEDRPTYNSKKVEKFADEDFEKIINDYISVSALYYTSPENLLIKLGLTDEEKVYDYADELILDEYCVTDIKFEDYKNAMLQYMTLDTFENNFCDIVRSHEGNVCYSSFWEDDNDYTYIMMNMTRDENFGEIEYSAEIKTTTQYDGDEDYFNDSTDTYYFEFTTIDDRLIVNYSDFSY